MTWRKRLAVWRNRLYLYPLPEPMLRTRFFWLASSLVALIVVLFSVYFILLHLGRQDAYLTPAEDLGTMDQAVWSLTHGQLSHQTVCNIVSDTNCTSLNGVSRFAIHFEPILFLVSLFYLIVSSPKTLLVLQTLVVAGGAFPAFWLARLRLRNELAAVGIAILYLLYPALQQAEIFDFHAVTLTSALLLFTLYFMYTRRTAWLFVFAILSMACKEEMPAVIAMFGLWSIVFQQRWRTGLGLVVLSLAWVGMTLLVYHFASPTGHPLLASRYAYLGNSPLQILFYFLRHPRTVIAQHLLEPTHRQYLRILLAPAGYLPVLAPWILVLAFPSIALNLLSSFRNQYLGVFQYNAEIVPVLIFATIESMVLITWVVQWLVKRLRARQEQQTWDGEASHAEQKKPAVSVRPGLRWLQPVVLFVLVGFTLFTVVHDDFTYGALPFSRAFAWPQVSQHNQIAQQLVAMIPPSASVSAQSSLVPHVSERSHVYLFPYADNTADYIFLDITSFTYPFESSPYTKEVKKVLLGSQYGVVAAQDGFLLLKRGLPPPGISPYSPVQSGSDAVPNLPTAFCSFMHVSPQEVQHALQVDFTPQDSPGSSISLVGYSVAPPQSFQAITPLMQVTAYWRVNTAKMPLLRVLTTLLDKHGKEEFSSIDFPALSWCPVSTWKPGTIVRTVGSAVYVGNVPHGIARVAIALLPYDVSFGTKEALTHRVPLHIVSAPMNVAVTPETNTVQVEKITV
jgi:uncharacterized membrane protein